MVFAENSVSRVLSVGQFHPLARGRWAPLFSKMRASNLLLAARIQGAEGQGTENCDYQLVAQSMTAEDYAGSCTNRCPFWISKDECHSQNDYLMSSVGPRVLLLDNETRGDGTSRWYFAPRGVRGTCSSSTGSHFRVGKDHDTTDGGRICPELPGVISWINFAA